MACSRCRRTWFATYRSLAGLLWDNISGPSSLRLDSVSASHYFHVIVDTVDTCRVAFRLREEAVGTRQKSAFPAEITNCILPPDKCICAHCELQQVVQSRHKNADFFAVIIFRQRYAAQSTHFLSSLQVTSAAQYVDF